MNQADIKYRLVVTAEYDTAWGPRRILPEGLRNMLGILIYGPQTVDIIQEDLNLESALERREFAHRQKSTKGARIEIM